MVMILGTLVLLSLGKWQLDRLAWKQGILDKINSRISGVLEPLPLNPSEQQDKYLPVLVEGKYGTDFVRVLVSKKHIGPGYRIISPFSNGQRTVLVDRGFIKISDTVPQIIATKVSVKGNLAWPSEIDAFTPEPDLENNIWFARDVSKLAAHFGTEETFIIASEVTPPEENILPLPVNTVDIPNDHLQYAITWFSLAAVWTFMSITFLWRTRNNAKGFDL